ncbi:MAG: hypothetical protein IKS31_10745 [Clostridia bacterium]|nr:hypothetical protein [Clostridia bacterium]
MKLLNKIFALLFCVIIITVQIPALAENNDAHVFFATFDISLRHNIIKSKYAVTVYLDGVKVDRMEQGDILTFGAYMSDGTTHELRFVADKKGVPDRVWTLGSLVPGSVLTCKLTAKHNQVKITSHTLSVNNQTIVSVSPDIEKAVKIAGTIIVYVVKAAGAAK